MSKRRLFIEFTDHEVRLLEIERKRKQLIVSNHKSASFEEFEEENLASALAMVLGKSKWLKRECQVLVSRTSLIAKNIEVPRMKTRDLESLLMNNIQDYFTTNADEYTFVHHITGEHDQEVTGVEGNLGKKTMMNVMLNAIPSKELELIKQVCSIKGLKVKDVETYATAVLKVFAKEDKDVAIVDVRDTKVSFTMFEGKNLFMHAGFNPKERDDFSYSNFEDVSDVKTTVLNNVMGYLNFYSSKHYGQKPSIICLLGDQETVESLHDALEMSYEGLVSRNHLPFTVKERKARQHFKFPKEDFTGLLSYGYSHEKKSSTNLLHATGDKGRQGKKDQRVVMAMIVGAILWTGYSVLYPFYTAQEEGRRLSEVKGDLAYHIDLKQRYDQYEALSADEQNKSTLLSQMESATVNFGTIVSVINTALPEGTMLVQFRYEEDGTIGTLFQMKDARLSGQLVDNLNELEVFETVRLDSVSLSNQSEPILLNLKIRPDAMSEFMKGEGDTDGEQGLQ